MTATLKLYEVGDDLVRLIEEVVDAGGVITPETEAHLDELRGLFAEKAERVALHVRNLEATAKAAREESRRIAAIAAARENAADGLRGYLLRELQRTGERRIQTPRVTIARQKGNKPRISWTRALEQLPAAYDRVTHAVNLVEAHAALDAGRPLPDGFVVEPAAEHLVLR